MYTIGKGAGAGPGGGGPGGVGGGGLGGVGTAVKPAAQVRQLSWNAVITPLIVALVTVLEQTRQFVSVLQV